MSKLSIFNLELTYGPYHMRVTKGLRSGMSKGEYHKRGNQENKTFYTRWFT